MNSESAEGAKYTLPTKIAMTAFNTHSALSALRGFQLVSPGPMAQAITFRAVGAEPGVFVRH